MGGAGIPDCEDRDSEDDSPEDLERFLCRLDPAPMALLAPLPPAIPTDVEMIDFAPEQAESLQARISDAAADTRDPPLRPARLGRDRSHDVGKSSLRRRGTGTFALPWWSLRPGGTGPNRSVQRPLACDDLCVFRIDPEEPHEPCNRVRSTRGTRSEDIQIGPRQHLASCAAVVRRIVPEMDSIVRHRDFRGHGPGECGHEGGSRA